MNTIKLFLLALLTFLLEPVQLFYRRTWCLYGAPDDELARMLAATSGEVKSFISKQRDITDELKARVLDLEQKGARRHGGGGGGDGGGADIIMAAYDSSDQVKAMLLGEGRGARFTVPIAALHTKDIYSTISGGTIGQADRGGVIVAPSQRRLTIRNLLPSIPTSAGATEFVQETSYTNNAGPQGSASPIGTGEGELKHASDMSFTLQTSRVSTIAHYFTLSRQALDDSAALRQHIETRGVYGLLLEEEDELLNGTGGACELSGLINNATAFTGGSTNLTRLDCIRRAITQVLKSDNLPNGIVLNPTDVESLELAKDSQLRYMAVVVNGPDGKQFVWRLPIVETNSMPVNKFLVGDFVSAATIRDRQLATVEFSLDHSDYRTRNLCLVLIEERIGLEINRGSALVYGALDNVG